MGYIEAYELYLDGEITLQTLGDVMVEEGFDPGEIRKMLSLETRTPIPVGYFGPENI